MRGLSGLLPGRREFFLVRNRTCSLRGSVYIGSSGQERQICVHAAVCLREQGKKKINQVKLKESWYNRVQGRAIVSEHQEGAGGAVQGNWG